GRVPVPWFVLAFLAVLLFNSVVTVHPQVRATILQGDQFLFLMVMIALGLTTPLKPLLGSGGLRLVGAGVFTLAASASVAYALVRVNHGTSTATPSASVSSIPSGQGARLFNAVGCAKCHVPSLRGIAGPGKRRRMADDAADRHAAARPIPARWPRGQSARRRAGTRRRRRNREETVLRTRRRRTAGGLCVRCFAVGLGSGRKRVGGWRSVTNTAAVRIASPFS
ncbi:MAG: putative sulfate exporter family transporter, partial [Burkholderiales bacterium]|nr:putative sulfate exporter family transporter [Burkholderiales bacterium]